MYIFFLCIIFIIKIKNNVKSTINKLSKTYY